MNLNHLDENLWSPLNSSSEDREKISSKSYTFMQDVWRKFYKKPTAILGLVVIVVMTLISLVGPNLSSYSQEEQRTEFANIPPKFSAYKVEDKYIYLTSGYKLLEVSEKGELMGPLTRIEDDGMRKKTTFDMGDNTEIVLNYKVKPAEIQSPNGEAYTSTVKMSNKSYLLGTDYLGRDVLTRLMMGTRISLLIAVIATLANIVIGMLYGGIAGYSGGIVDTVMMRIVEIVSTIPLTLYVILIQVIFPDYGGMVSIIIALATVYWVDMARVVRGQMLTLKEQDYVHASKTAGASTWRILTRHLIPNAMGPIIVTITMLIPSAIAIEAFMSFIGLGVTYPNASLGTMCNEAIGTLRSSPYQLFLPALAICLIMFAFNFVGDGLRDALDPKLTR